MARECWVAKDNDGSVWLYDGEPMWDRVRFIPSLACRARKVTADLSFFSGLREGSKACIVGGGGKVREDACEEVCEEACEGACDEAPDKVHLRGDVCLGDMSVEVSATSVDAFLESIEKLKGKRVKR